MTSNSSIGAGDPRTQESGIDDEALAEESTRKAREDGESVLNDQPRPDLTREDIEAGNDRNASADQNNRSGRTNKLDGDSIDIAGS